MPIKPWAAGFQGNKGGDAPPRICEDVAVHCSTWADMKVQGDFITSTHEGTHGVNADIRNGTLSLKQAKGSRVASGNGVGVPRLKLFAPGPVRDVGNINAQYLLNDTAQVLPEPDFAKSDIVTYIPDFFRGFRFATYITGQQEWDSSPLYVWDEWSAYINGAMCAVELVQNGTNKPDGSDWCRAPLEFCAYGLAVTMLAADNGKLDVYKQATTIMLTRAFNAFFAGRTLFPFDGQEEYYTAWRSGEEGKLYRDFALTHLGWAVPDGIKPWTVGAAAGDSGCIR
jgi:hypothetical protein